MADEIGGMDEFLSNLQKLQATTGGAALGQAMMAGGEVLQGAIKISFQGSKGGRTYKRGGKSHTASAPGEPPAIDYGFLLGSIKGKLTNTTETSATVEVSADKEYAGRLEFGTGKMAARPFMRPAMDKNKEKITEAVAVTLKRKINEVRGA
jgi:HK97 gp10 family phage protein